MSLFSVIDATTASVAEQTNGSGRADREHNRSGELEICHSSLQYLCGEQSVKNLQPVAFTCSYLSVFICCRRDCSSPQERQRNDILLQEDFLPYQLLYIAPNCCSRWRESHPLIVNQVTIWERLRFQKQFHRSNKSSEMQQATINLLHSGGPASACSEL